MSFWDFCMQILLLYPRSFSIYNWSKLSLVHYLKQVEYNIMFILFRPCSLLIGRCHSFPCSVHWIISSNILDGGCVTAKRSSRASRRCHIVISGCSSETVCTCDSGTLKIPRGSPPKISVFPGCLKLHRMSNT